MLFQAGIKQTHDIFKSPQIKIPFKVVDEEQEGEKCEEPGRWNAKKTLSLPLKDPTTPASNVEVFPTSYIYAFEFFFFFCFFINGMQCGLVAPRKLIGRTGGVNQLTVLSVDFQ